MSRIEKLKSRLKENPKNFTYWELKKLLESLGFYEYNKGKTSGSRVMFINIDNNSKIELHKPHPDNTVKPYIIKNVIQKLKEIGVI